MSNAKNIAKAKSLIEKARQEKLKIGLITLIVLGPISAALAIASPALGGLAAVGSLAFLFVKFRNINELINGLNDEIVELTE